MGRFKPERSIKCRSKNMASPPKVTPILWQADPGLSRSQGLPYMSSGDARDGNIATKTHLYFTTRVLHQDVAASAGSHRRCCSRPFSINATIIASITFTPNDLPFISGVVVTKTFAPVAKVFTSLGVTVFVMTILPSIRWGK